MDELSCREKIMSNDYYDLIVDFSFQADQFGSDYCNIRLPYRAYISYVNRNILPELSIAEYSYAIIPKLYGLLSCDALLASGILNVQQSFLKLTGRGIMVGFIDTGIDYRKEAFRFPDGSTRIAAIWDQTIQTGDSPKDLPYGTEYLRAQINQALIAENPFEIVPSRDEFGHGTAMAQVAAGSFPEGSEYCGAAPECVIAAVKCKDAKPYLKEFYAVNEDVFAISEADLLTAVQYLNALAERNNMPLVICMGVGTNLGDHNGRSSLAQFMDIIALNNLRTIVVAGGNEGNARHHVEGGGEYSEVEIHVAEREKGFFMELWGSAPDVFSISLRSPGGEIVERIQPRLGESSEFRFLYDRTVVTVDYRIVERETGGELIAVRFRNPSPGIWVIGVYGSPTNQGNYHMWLPLTGFISEDTYFLRSSPDVTLTEPSNAFAPITVSGYNEITGGIYADGSRGFTRSGSVKPDLSAPAVGIRTDVGTYTGTSMAAAMTAGAAADFLEWAAILGNAPNINSEDVKNYFKKGAVREIGVSYPNQQEGDDGIIVHSIC